MILNVDPSILFPYFCVCLITAVLSFGWTYAYFQRIYNGTDDYVFSAFVGVYTLLFPPMVIVVFYLSRFARYGWRIR